MGPVPHRIVIARGALAAIALVAALAGCRRGGSSTPAPPAKPTVVIAVSPSATSNRSRPVHAIVRMVTIEQFAQDQDRAIAQLVVSPDDSVLSSFVVFPGLDQTVTIDRPSKGAVALYFLFTGATGTSWKQLFDTAPASIHVELGEDAILNVSSVPVSAEAPAKKK